MLLSRFGEIVGNLGVGHVGKGNAPDKGSSGL